MLWAALLITAQAVSESPVERVVTLLRDLQTQVQAEGTEEATTYDTFACHCKDTTESKVESIQTREESVQSLTADAAQLDAESTQLKSECEKLTEDIGTAEEALAKATALREKEHADYSVAYADMSKAVDSLSRAIASIEDSKMSLASVQSMLRPTLLMADAMSLLPKKHRAALLEESPTPFEKPDEDYSFHSNDIIGILQDLHTDFSKKKSELESEEEAASQSFNAAADAKRSEIESNKDTLATKTSQLADKQADLATTNEDLTETTALMHDDRTYLKDLTEQCERKAREWDQRSSMRTEELKAIATALEIIEGTVLSREESTGAGGRSEPVGAALMESGEDSDDFIEDYLADAFVQVRRVEVRKSDAAAPRNRVIAELKVRAARLQSPELTLLAMKLAADPFAKVKGLIQQLIQRLLQEAKDEATHKGWCDTELGKANHNRDSRHQDVLGLTAGIEELEARKAKLVQQKDQLTVDIATLTESLTNATNARADEKANNDATLKDANEALVALTQAISVLTEFYKKAAKGSVSFAQASPVDEDMAAAGTGGFAGAYQGNQAQGTGIIGILQTIQSDFERTVSETEAAEKQSYRDFVAFSKDTKASKAAKETGLTQTEGELVQTSGNLQAALEDLKQQQQLLDTALRALEALRPACIDTGMSFEERVKRREAEIEALKGCLEILSENEGFLQK
jgi:peptidoglycan hydrolase CwlO-like protein